MPAAKLTQRSSWARSSAIRGFDGDRQPTRLQVLVADLGAVGRRRARHVAVDVEHRLARANLVQGEVATLRATSEPGALDAGRSFRAGAGTELDDRRVGELVLHREDLHAGGQFTRSPRG